MKPRLLAAMLALLFFSGIAVAAETVRIGVLAFRPKDQTQRQWQPLADGLKRKLPDHEFVIQALNYHELRRAVTNNQLDLVFTNPAYYIFLKYRHGLSAPLATLVNYQSGKPISGFGGVIFTKADRAGLNRLADIRGKTIAVTERGSFGGYQMQAYELVRHGVNISQEAKLLITDMPHDKVVRAVLDGRADVGFVRSGVLEAMAQEGNINLADFKILNEQRQPGYSTLLSTRVYPEWPIAAMPHVDIGLAGKITAALLTLEDDPSLTAAIKIQGFVIPADYAPVEEVLRSLRVSPFDALPEITIADLWQLYRWQIMGACGAALVIVFLGVRLLRVNRQLTVKQQLIKDQSQRIKASEQLWKFALEGAGDGVWDWQIETGKTYFSPRWVEMLGYQPHQFANDYDTWFAHIHADDVDMVLATLREYLNGKTALYQVEFRMRCNDGEYKWILARGMVVERAADGKPLRMIGTHSDINERKQFQITLQSSFDLLHNLARQIPGFIYQYQLYPDGRSCFPFASAGIEQIYEVSAEQVREDATPVFAVLHPDDVDGVWASIQASAQNLRPWHHEYRVILPKSGLRWLLGNARAERLADGSVLWYGYVSDVTNRKDDELRLQRQTEALQRSNADLEQFAYSVSHDMRQPLRTIAGHLQLLERGLKDSMDQENLDNLNFALDGAKRMDAMIVSLLEYSRVGRKTEPKAAIPSREALDEALFFLGPVIKQSGAAVTPHGEWPQIFASRDELTRLFQNLIGNALKYQAVGSTARIRVNSEINNGLEWRVAIEDNGIGIAAGQSQRLFQFFSRLQARSRYEGTGMGLALCRRIVEHHGGRIWVESAGEGQGSTFIFVIPLEQTAVADSASGSP
ncbi:PhnD/SsuA/transferrin family substrate-binding protein [Methylomonas sp. LL1]|uniref:PhnD/SsuA/transferrin family substrate-binding protein n=1 Tax=Methylomonas sp. LL1 TaxID=2785785 RepID=UPI0018C397D5|nr:PhnD/SsuA/transferrin family substrate-binding protein [Methylomonas sp. LL1]QPK63186.1 PhnD/SsuA/transferrin family substrate-binding protein [Methylomonas sp. LL1]